MLDVVAFTLYGRQAASTRYRFEQFVPGLRALGISLRIVPLLDNDYLQLRFAGQRIPPRLLGRAVWRRLQALWSYRSCDLAIVYSELMPLAPPAIEQRLLRRPYVYDFDDAFYLKYRNSANAVLARALGDKFSAIIAGARAVTAGSPELFAHARALNQDVTLLPTVVDTDHYARGGGTRPRPGAGEPFTIGWIGSPSTAPYLASLVEPLAALGAEGPVRLVVIGGEAPAIAGVDVRQVEWREDTEIDLLYSFDVGVMPLPDTDWARGKCAFKLIQYMACGLPVVASDVGANSSLVTPDVGFLATSSADWLAALRALRDDPALRHRLGQAGQQVIEQGYSLKSALPVLAGVLRRAAGR